MGRCVPAVSSQFEIRRILEGPQQQQQRSCPRCLPSLPPLSARRRRCMHERASPSSAGAPAGGQEPGSAADRAKLMADGERRAAAAAARHRQDPAVMEVVDGLLESVPPSEAMYVLRLLAHAVDPPEVARENADALTEDFFQAIRTLLTSPQFKQATSCGTPRAASVVSVFDSAWRAAMEARGASGRQS